MMVCEVLRLDRLRKPRNVRGRKGQDGAHDEVKPISCVEKPVPHLASG